MTPPVHTAQNESRIIHSPWLGDMESDPRKRVVVSGRACPALKNTAG